MDIGDRYVCGVHTAPSNSGEPTHFEAAVESADFTPKRSGAVNSFYRRASHTGAEKVNAQFTLKAICRNLLSDWNKICLRTESGQQSVRDVRDELKAIRNAQKSG